MFSLVFISLLESVYLTRNVLYERVSIHLKHSVALAKQVFNRTKILSVDRVSLAVELFAHKIQELWLVFNRFLVHLSDAHTVKLENCKSAVSLDPSLKKIIKK